MKKEREQQNYFYTLVTNNFDTVKSCCLLVEETDISAISHLEYSSFEESTKNMISNIPNFFGEGEILIGYLPISSTGSIFAKYKSSR